MNFNLLVDNFLNNEIEKVVLEYNMVFLNEVELIEVTYCGISNHFILKNVSSGYLDYLLVNDFIGYLNVDGIKIYEVVNYICA